ncbi:MAG: GTPase ObgE [Planctomycetota bacterium]
MFVDQAIIQVKAGNGGDGAMSFYRGRALPKGGPDGGDGGDGGDVIFASDSGLNTLFEFRGKHHWEARGGEPGRGKQQFGKAADDMIIRVPEGTQIYDNDSGELIVDLGPGDSAVICRGGRGGHGNEHYKSSTNQAPRRADKGEPGESLEIRLELKVIAEVGFVGLPNAGKSTMLKALTRADPKIADYPFTTLAPQLGIATLDPSRRLVLADIPGLIEGAADGAGLGHDFLRHVERTRVILHVVDAQPTDGSDPAENYRTIREELEGYSSELAGKPEVLAINKLDLLFDDEERERVVRELLAELQLGADTPVVRTSGAAGIGLNDLLEKLWRVVHPEGGEIAAWKVAD